MIKFINYFFQSFFIYLFFIIGRIIGLKVSRKLFASIFSIMGPVFKSKITIQNNLEIFSKKYPELNNKNITDNMWRNYGMTFIEYIF